jgi:hypothetical protein
MHRDGTRTARAGFVAVLLMTALVSAMSFLFLRRILHPFGTAYTWKSARKAELRGRDLFGSAGNFAGDVGLFAPNFG